MERERDHQSTPAGYRPSPTAAAGDRSAGSGALRAGVATVRPATEGDAGAMAALHAGQIAEGFLSSLGPGFLRRLYRRVVLSPTSFALVAVDGRRQEDGGGVDGFIAGTTDLGRLYRSFLLHDGAGAAVAAAGPLARSWRQALETWRHGTGGSTGAGTDGDEPELLAVAVAPGARGRGAGTLLVEGFLDEVRMRGHDRARVVVAADNHTAVALYRRCGFEAATRFELHPGTTSALLRWRAPAGAGSHGEGPDR